MSRPQNGQLKMGAAFAPLCLAKKPARHNGANAAWVGKVRSCKKAAVKHCAFIVLVSQVGLHMEGHIRQSSGGAQSLPALRHELPTLTAKAKASRYDKGFVYYYIWRVCKMIKREVVNFDPSWLWVIPTTTKSGRIRNKE